MTVEPSVGTTSRLPILPVLRVLMLSPGSIASCQIINTLFQGLHNQGALSYLCLYDNETQYEDRRDAVRWADIIFFFRSFDPQALSLLRLAKEGGKGTIYCTDDDFLQLERKSPLGKIHHSPENANAFRAMFSEADLVWLFTQEMVERYRKFNSRIVLGRLPSPFEVIPLTELGELNDDQSYTIGYAGGLVHQKDLKIAIKPLRRLLKDFASSLRIEFVGYMPEELRGHPKVRHIPYFGNLVDFYLYMSKAKWTIGLALLEDTPFNRGKTNNKYREYAAFGIPGIYSDMPVYSSCIKHCVNGYLTPNTEEGISEALSTMLKDGHLRENIRKSALQDVTSSYSLKAAQLQLLQEISSLAIEKIHPYNKPKLLVIGYDRVSTTHIGALQPCREMRRRNLLDFIWREPGQVTDQDVGNIDCVYLVRAFEAVNLPVLQWMEQKQKPMICSWDDNFFMLPEDTPLGQIWTQKEVRDLMKMFLNKSSLIIASTPPLAALSRTFNPNVMEAVYGLAPPDCIDIDNQQHNSACQKIRIGYFGMNEGINTSFMIDTLKELRRRYHNRIIIESIGPVVKEEISDVIDTQFGIVQNCDNALSFLKSRRWDIGLAPLADSEFNAAKQATKFRDYAWCGAAIVASDVPTYRRTIINGIHGLLVENTPTAWVKAIVSLIEEPETRQFLIKGAKQLLDNVYLQDKTIASWYQLVWRVMRFESEKIAKTDSASISHQEEIAFVQEGIESPFFISSAEGLTKRYLSYHLLIRNANWTGLDICLQKEQGAECGVMTLSVFSQYGNLLRQTSVDLANGPDEDGWLSFRFPPISNSAGQIFLLRFVPPIKGPDSRKIFFENNFSEPLHKRLLRKMRVKTLRNTIPCRIWYAQ